MLENERKKKLLNTMKQFNKNQKEEVFTFGNEIEEIPIISTGIESFDNFIGGGFKRGGHTIIYGAFSVGKTALILMAIANAQRQGYTVCYVNTEKPIEPERFKFFGIDLDNLAYIEAPANAELALEALRTLTKEKVIDLFVIDSKDGLCPKSVQQDSKGKERALEKSNIASLPKTLSEFYNTVNAHIFKARASVVWISQMRTKGIGSYFVRNGLTGGNAQLFYAYQIIYMRKGQKSNNPVKKFKEFYLDPDGKLRYITKSEDVGFSVVLKMDKTNSSKSVKENKEIEIPFYYDSGFTQVQIQKTEEIEIRIDPLMPEPEQEKVREMLIEKGILEEIPLLETNSYINKKSLKESVDTSTAVEGVNINSNKKTKKVIINKVTLTDDKRNEKTIIDNVKKKRGRGRPKKKKEINNE